MMTADPRQPLVALLHAYLHRYPQEQAEVQRCIDFVRHHPNCCDRQLWQPGHLTGSAWLVNTAGTHVLLTHHRKLDLWIQLGGHADGNPDLRAVALAEAYEESGLPQLEWVTTEVFDVAIHQVPTRGSDPAHEHFDLRFAIRAVGSETYAVGTESHDLAWVPIEHLADYTQEASMLRMARKWHCV